ncbi:50S ribosomal protein L9 [bacterium]
MKIILLQDVARIGKSGEIKKVSQGYAMNFLIPKKMALSANDKNMRVYEHKRFLEKKKQEKLVHEAELRAKELEKLSCTISVKVGEDDKMFGSVTNADVAKFIKDSGFEIDKKDIKLDEPIKELGVYTIEVKLHQQVTGKVKLWIVKE